MKGDKPWWKHRYRENDHGGLIRQEWQFPVSVSPIAIVKEDEIFDNDRSDVIGLNYFPHSDKNYLLRFKDIDMWIA